MSSPGAARPGDVRSESAGVAPGRVDAEQERVVAAAEGRRVWPARAPSRRRAARSRPASAPRGGRSPRATIRSIASSLSVVEVERLPVVPQDAPREEWVEDLLERRVGHRRGKIQQRRAQLRKAAGVGPSPSSGRPAYIATDDEPGAAVELLREAGNCRNRPPRGRGIDLVRGTTTKSRNPAMIALGFLQRIERAGEGDHRPNRVEPVLERGDDAEVAAAAAQRPEQVGVLASRWRSSRRPSAVTTSAESRLSQVRPCVRRSQPRPPPSVRPAMPVVETMPPGAARPKRLGLAVDVAPGSAAVGAGGAARRDRRATPRIAREVDHQATVADAEARRRCGRRPAPPASRPCSRAKRTRGNDVGDAGSAGRSGPVGGRSCRSRPAGPRRRRDHQDG